MSRRTFLAAAAGLAMVPAVPSPAAPARPLRCFDIDWSGPVLPASDVELTPAELKALQMPPAPDAGLLALCARHLRLNREEVRLLTVMRTFDAADPSPAAKAAETAWDQATDRSWAAFEAVVDMPATTFEGIKAKARSALAYRRSYETEEVALNGSDFNERAMLCVLADLDRLMGGAA